MLKKLKYLLQDFWYWMRGTHAPVWVYLLDADGNILAKFPGSIIRLHDQGWMGKFETTARMTKLNVHGAVAVWKGVAYDISEHTNRHVLTPVPWNKASGLDPSQPREVIRERRPRVIKRGDRFGSQFFLREDKRVYFSA